MKIGEFAKVCGISVSALRYYDEQGLISPVYTDRFTGYRYYGKGEVYVFPCGLNAVILFHRICLQYVFFDFGKILKRVFESVFLLGEDLAYFLFVNRANDGFYFRKRKSGGFDTNYYVFVRE